MASQDTKPFNDPTIRVGALAPLSRPGWIEAGRHLLAGLELAVEDVNRSGGIEGRSLEMVVCDTAADPQRAEAAVEAFTKMNVVAVTGEYHSVVARSAANSASTLRVPFLCSSAVIDELTDSPTQWVARIAPPQSQGWKAYADYLLTAGHRRIAIAAAASVYWSAGIRILRHHLASNGSDLVELDMTRQTDMNEALFSTGATALLLLVGFPDAAVTIVKAIRRDPRLASILVGAPAGQPEFAEWHASLDGDGSGVSFLRYRSERLTPLGTLVEDLLRQRLLEAPSFVALEGYDSIIALAAAMRSHGADRDSIAAAWPLISAEGTRGTIAFSRTGEERIWQWTGAPIQVVDRDPGDPQNFRILHSGTAAAGGPDLAPHQID